MGGGRLWIPNDTQTLILSSTKPWSCFKPCVFYPGESPGFLPSPASVQLGQKPASVSFNTSWRQPRHFVLQVKRWCCDKWTWKKGKTYYLASVASGVAFKYLEEALVNNGASTHMPARPLACPPVRPPACPHSPVLPNSAQVVSACSGSSQVVPWLSM